MLHMNELPLRHLVKSFDGIITGPKSFNGPLGKQLADVECKPIVEFEVISAESLGVISSDLSTDQKYLYDMYEAVSSGHVNDSLSCRNPGNISHSRWLTTANRFLRLYVSTEDPCDNLVRIVKYIMFCYIPTWFSIKRHESIIYGSKNLFSLVQRCQKLDEKTKKVVQPVIQNNAYFAHSECLLLAMIADHDINLRKLALIRVLKARNSENASVRRVYRIPTMNFEASIYGDMITWTSDQTGDMDSPPAYTEPPVLSGYSEEDLKWIVTEGKIPGEIYRLPSHNQRVERAIKLVSEASNKAANKLQREGIIQTVIASRKELPKSETKKQFQMKIKFK